MKGKFNPISEAAVEAFGGQPKEQLVKVNLVGPEGETLTYDGLRSLYAITKMTGAYQQFADIAIEFARQQDQYITDLECDKS